MKKSIIFALGAGLLIFSVSAAIAQEVQKATIVLTDYKLEPSELTIRPGKVAFTLINKGTVRHNLRLKIGEKDLKLNSTQKSQLKAAVDAAKQGIAVTQRLEGNDR